MSQDKIAEADVLDEVRNYLISGGMFNPEWAIHDNVRDMIMRLRDEVQRLRALSTPRDGWIEVTPETMPEYGFPVLGYNPDWVHEDYNPKGIRECQHCDGEWSTAAWNGTHDEWYNSPEDPTHWRHQPLPPAPESEVGE